MLSPRFGVLSWDVEAFLGSARRDLFFVPVAITYERLVEEGAMVDELQGGKKTKESVLGLVRARRFLRSRFGSVHMSFSEPVSLAEALGDRRIRFRREEDEESGAEKRAFVESFGYHLAERINWSAVANATSVAATVLLGSPHRGLLRSELVQRMRGIVDLLRAQGVGFTAALEADTADFSESLAFLENAHLVHVDDDPRGAVAYFDESRRRALDIYRNSIAHYMAGPSFMARRLLVGVSAKELQEDLDAWQAVFFHEYFVASSGPDARTLLEHFEAQGLVQCHDDDWEATRSGRGFLGCLSEQTLGVLEVYRAMCDGLLISLDSDEATLSRKQLEKAAEAEFERDRLLGRSGRVEAANTTTYGNVLRLLQGRGVLSTRQREGRRSSIETVLARGEHWEALAGLRDRLAAALSDG
jgi:glycerol-3-phosphate O-acyltransferase